MYLSNDFDDYTVVYSSTKKISQKTSASHLSNTPKIIEIGLVNNSGEPDAITTDFTSQKFSEI